MKSSDGLNIIYIVLVVAKSPYLNTRNAPKQLHLIQRFALYNLHRFYVLNQSNSGNRMMMSLLLDFISTLNIKLKSRTELLIIINQNNLEQIPQSMAMKTK